MQIPKPTDEDKAYFGSLVPDHPDVEVKAMFGNLGAFVNGNMFAGLFGSAVGVRVGDAMRVELAAIDGVGPFGPAERPMGGYLALPAAWRSRPEQAQLWVRRALQLAVSLPPKAARPRKVSGRQPS